MSRSKIIGTAQWMHEGGYDLATESYVGKDEELAEGVLLEIEYDADAFYIVGLREGWSLALDLSLLARAILGDGEGPALEAADDLAHAVHFVKLPPDARDKLATYIEARGV